MEGFFNRGIAKVFESEAVAELQATVRTLERNRIECIVTEDELPGHELPVFLRIELVLENIHTCKLFVCGWLHRDTIRCRPIEDRGGWGLGQLDFYPGHVPEFGLDDNAILLEARHGDSFYPCRNVFGRPTITLLLVQLRLAVLDSESVSAIEQLAEHLDLVLPPRTE